MAVINDQSTLVGNFKDQYGEGVITAFAFIAKLANAIKFDNDYGTLGQTYIVPVDLTLEHGWTATAGGTTPTGSGYLNPSAGQSQKASVDGFSLYGRAQVSYEAIMRSVGNKQAFRSATEWVFKKLGLSGSKRLELQILHGQEGLGAISANPSTGSSRPVVLTDDSWSAGIWAGMEGATIDLYNSGGTKQNTAAITISSVSVSAKSLVLSCPNASDQSLNLANLNIFLETHSPTTEMAGLGKIAGNTGPLFGINAANYTLWAGNSQSNTGSMNFQKLLDFMSVPASYGLAGRKAVAVVPTKLFEVLNTDQAALRKYDVSYRPATAETGSEGLVYHSQTGTLEVMPHPFQKDGRLNIFVPDEAKRIGATDLTMIDKGEGAERIIFDSPTSPAKEMRAFSNQSVFVEQPRHTFVATGITY